MNQIAEELTSVQKFNQRSIRMSSDFKKIIMSLSDPREGFIYSDSNRDHMRDILNSPKFFSVDDKINTFLSFHKDTCANVIVELCPSTGEFTDYVQRYGEDLKILESFERILVGIRLEYNITHSEAFYQHLRAKKQLYQMKASMSVFSKSPDAAQLQKNIQNWMQSDGINYHDFDNDNERLQSLEEAKTKTLAHLQSLGVDVSNQDSNDDDQYLNDQPTQATIKEYTAEITRTKDKVLQVSENLHPVDRYIADLKRHVEFMKRELARVVNEGPRKSRLQMNRQKKLKNKARSRR